MAIEPAPTYKSSNLTQHLIISHPVALVGEHVRTETERDDIAALVVVLLERDVVALDLLLAVGDDAL